MVQPGRSQHTTDGRPADIRERATAVEQRHRVDEPLAAHDRFCLPAGTRLLALREVPEAAA